MKITKIGKIGGGQDGAIYGSELFRFDSRGNCAVYGLTALADESEELTPFAHFTLDRTEALVPHSNAVCFGCEFYEEGDRYPLLYTNIYNNYAAEKRMIGVCLAYRIRRTEEGFTSKLVQCIEIGFSEDATLWKAYPDRHGVRPYGNFIIDPDRRALWAFVMRSEESGTRYFRFDLPPVREGETDRFLGMKKRTLQPTDIREFFDGAYCRFLQGAAVYEGVLYSTEGFCADRINRPAIRRIDLAARREDYFDITEYGMDDEPEFIDFYNGKCLYSDISGNLFSVTF